MVSKYSGETLIHIEGLKKYFPITRGLFRRHVANVKAVDGISFDICCHETLGLVGESGSGKSTVGRTILQLYRPTAGEVCMGGANLAELKGKELQQMRRRMQMIFQDCYASLNPRMTIGSIISEPLEIYKVSKGKEKQERVEELLQMVGLDPRFANRYPHEFSGGQRQRICIARALTLQPEFIVCDEPITSLDVSVQAQVVNLLEDLQERFNLTYLFITHDLRMVRHLCDRVAVMYLGKIVELADCNTLYTNPMHPYTQALLSAVPVPDPAHEEQKQYIRLEGDIPSPSNPPKGCNFCTRCPVVQEKCMNCDPELSEVAPGHWVACFFANSR